MNKNEIDILHVNSSVFNYLYGHIKKRSKVNIITHIREYFPPKGNQYYRHLIIKNITEYSDKIICISDNEAKYFLNNPRSITLTNPFNFKDISNNSTLRKDNEIRVAMIANIGKAKGHYQFLKSLQIYHRKL